MKQGKRYQEAIKLVDTKKLYEVSKENCKNVLSIQTKDDLGKIPSRKLRHYMVRYLEIMMTISSILAIKSGQKENMEKKKELWQYLRKKNFPLFFLLCWGFLGQGMNLPGRSGRTVSIAGYKISQKFFGFN